MLNIKNLSKSYEDIKILNSLNLTVNKGDIYGFLGQNGAGKTTTLKCITNILEFDTGEIEIPKNTVIGYLSESPSFYEYMTAYEYIKYLYQINHSEKSSSHLEGLLNQVGLLKHKNKKIKHFSRGMKQRLGIASTLINNPDLILLDEPTSALDPKGRQDVMDIILDLNSKGKTILFSTHILNDVERICNRVGILHNNKLTQEGLLSDILKPSIQYMITVKDSNIAKQFIESHLEFEFVSQEENLIIFSFSQESDLVLKKLIQMDTEIIAFNKHTLTLQEIYLRTVNS